MATTLKKVESSATIGCQEFPRRVWSYKPLPSPAGLLAGPVCWGGGGGGGLYREPQLL